MNDCLCFRRLSLQNLLKRTLTWILFWTTSPASTPLLLSLPPTPVPVWRLPRLIPHPRTSTRHHHLLSPILRPRNHRCTPTRHHHHTPLHILHLCTTIHPLLPTLLVMAYHQGLIPKWSTYDLAVGLLRTIARGLILKAQWETEEPMARVSQSI